MYTYINDIYLVVPEIYFLGSILSLLWISVGYSINNRTIGKLLSVQVGSLVIGIILVTVLLYSNIGLLTYVVFKNNGFNNDIINKFFLYFGLVGTLSIVLLGINFVKINNLNAYELFFIFMFVLFGFILLSLSNDFLTLYMGLEMQSLGLYILATLKQGSIFATEAGLKYFVLGAFSSCLLILGIAIIYSFTGLLTFSELNLFIVQLYEKEFFYQGFFIGILLFFVSLLFKVGGAPFHVWLPDVYEGVATLITGFFAVVPKVIIFGVILKINMILGEFFLIEFKFIFIISSFLSFFIGTVGALYQESLKRMLSYSAIGHTGFILLVISLGTIEGLISTLFYCVIYSIISINIFASLLQVQQLQNRGTLKCVKNFGYIYKINELLGLNLIISLFSLGGIPPFSGFFSKFYVFLATVQQEYFFIAFYAIFCSVIGNGYILKIIRNIMFLKVFKKYYLIHDVTTIGGNLIMYSGIFNFFFIFFCVELHYVCSNIVMSYFI